MIFTSLYIHIPFCTHRCGYCDFNTYAGLQDLIPTYTQAVCNELEFLSQSISESIPVHTIYFGGGTPSLVPANHLEAMLKVIRGNFDIVPAPEATIEANPGAVSEEYLAKIQHLGVNRLSLGMQSARQEELKLLERQHTFEDVVGAVEWARKAGINNLNLDLIFGLPDQTVKSWMDSLEAALSLEPEHLSLYALTLEHGTPMQHKVESGVLAEPDPDVAADMYEAASVRLNEAGYTQYEISNWAHLDHSGELASCKHNLQYWRNLPYLGVGAGAHGFINKVRTVNVPTPGAYIERLINKPPVTNHNIGFPHTAATITMNQIDTNTEIGETMMMGLRLVSEGVSNQEFVHRFGMSLKEQFGRQIEKLISQGLLEWNNAQEERLRLTSKGRLLGNRVFSEFI